MPQYNRAYCIPAQASICHNTAEPTVCMLRLLYACSGCYMPARAAICLLSLLPPVPRVPSACAVSWAGCVVLQHSPAFFPCLSQLYCNTMPSQTSPQSQYNKCIATQPQLPSPSYCNTIPLLLQFNFLPLHILYCNTIPYYNTIFLLLQYNCNTIFFSSPLSCNTLAIQIFQPSLLQYNCKVAIQIFFFSQYN